MGNIEQAELLRTFNCGLGMFVVVDPMQADEVAGFLTAQGERVSEIGHLTMRGDGEAVTFEGTLAS
jgi:phosphoribosylformylglycinamidine cyclo-ligase